MTPRDGETGMVCGNKEVLGGEVHMRALVRTCAVIKVIIERDIKCAHFDSRSVKGTLDASFYLLLWIETLWP